MKKASLLCQGLLGFVIWGIAAAAPAVETKVITDSQFSDFNDGTTTGIAVLSTGQLGLGPVLVPDEKTTAALSWAVLSSKDKTVMATGPAGSVWTRDGDHGLTMTVEFPDCQLVSLLRHPDAGILIGTAPTGKIMKLDHSSTATLWFDTGEKYVWDMCLDRDGNLYAATGPNGKIFKVDKNGKGALYAQSGSTNVLKMDFVPGHEGKTHLLAACQGKAQLVRFKDEKTSYVLYSSMDDEAKAFAADPVSGEIYLAVNASSNTSAIELPRSTVSSSSGAESKALESLVSSMSSLSSMSSPISVSSPASRSGGKSTIVRISPTGFVLPLWQAPESPIYDIYRDARSGSLLVACGRKGGLYRVEQNGTFAKIGQVACESISRLTSGGTDAKLTVSTSNKAELYQLDDSGAGAVEFCSRVLTSGQNVKWGAVEISTVTPVDNMEGLKVELRTGNSPTPNSGGWSDWEPLELKNANGVITCNSKSPVSACAQYKITISAADKGRFPNIDGVSIYYVQANIAPVFTTITANYSGSAASRSMSMSMSSPISISAMPSGLSMGSGSSVSSGSNTGNDSRLLMERLGASLSGAGAMPRSDMAGQSGTPSLRKDDGVKAARTKATSLDVSWSASDPNGDKLRYVLYYKAQDENEWRRIDDNIKDTKVTLPIDFLSDGLYQFKAEGYDDLSNSSDSALSATIVSKSIIVDNTAPKVESFTAEKKSGRSWSFKASVKDDLSKIAALEFDVDDVKSPIPLLPKDGLFDQSEETFAWSYQFKEDAKEYVATIRVTDAAGNQAVRKLVLKAK